MCVLAQLMESFLLLFSRSVHWRAHGMQGTHKSPLFTLNQIQLQEGFLTDLTRVTACCNHGTGIMKETTWKSKTVAVHSFTFLKKVIKANNQESQNSQF